MPTKNSTNSHPRTIFSDAEAAKLLGFNNRYKSLTEYPSPRKIKEPTPVNFSDLSRWERDMVQLQNDKTHPPGVSVSIYGSGEITTGAISLGKRNNVQGRKRGKMYTTQMSVQGKKNIRRAIQNHKKPFTAMVGLTFDPTNPRNKYDSDGTINHDYAQAEYSRFQNSLMKKFTRMYEQTGHEKWQLSIIRVTELQKNGNIHFHLLVDRFIPLKWMLSLWGQASNSVDIDKLRNPGKAYKYLMKYITKDENGIYGKRYSMTENLYGEIKPTKVQIIGRAARSIYLDYKDKVAKDILKGRGYLGDYACCLPPPTREGITKYENRTFLIGLAEVLADGGYPQLLDHITGENYYEAQ